MKAKDTDLYHLDCFSCDSCKTRIGRGDPCTLHEDRILCSETQCLEPNEGGFSSGKTLFTMRRTFVVRVKRKCKSSKLTNIMQSYKRRQDTRDQKE